MRSLRVIMVTGMVSAAAALASASQRAEALPIMAPATAAKAASAAGLIERSGWVCLPYSCWWQPYDPSWRAAGPSPYYPFGYFWPWLPNSYQLTAPRLPRHGRRCRASRDCAAG